MKRNEIPINLTGFGGYVARLNDLSCRIDDLDARALQHWLKLLPLPFTCVKWQQREKSVKKKKLKLVA